MTGKYYSIYFSRVGREASSLKDDWPFERPTFFGCKNVETLFNWWATRKSFLCHLLHRKRILYDRSPTRIRVCYTYMCRLLTQSPSQRLWGIFSFLSLFLLVYRSILEKLRDWGGTALVFGALNRLRYVSNYTISLSFFSFFPISRLNLALAPQTITHRKHFSSCHQRYLKKKKIHSKKKNKKRFCVAMTTKQFCLFFWRWNWNNNRWMVVDPSRQRVAVGVFSWKKGRNQAGPIGKSEIPLSL